MPIISPCPKCQQPVVIPEGVAAEAEVRCPLCAAVFPMSEAMAELPPALIPIDTSSLLPADSQAAVSSGLVSEPFHVPDSEASSQVDGSDAQGESVPDMWKKVDTVPTIDTGEDASSEATPSADIDPNVLAGFAIEEEGEPETPAAGDSPSTQVRRPRRKRRKQKSMTREILGALIGGAVGLLIGYYILMWCFGDDLGLPKFNLPWLPHTMNESDESDDADDAKEDVQPGKSESNSAKEDNPRSFLPATHQDNIAPLDSPNDPDATNDGGLTRVSGEQDLNSEPNPDPFGPVDNEPFSSEADPFANPQDAGAETPESPSPSVEVDPTGAVLPDGLEPTPLPLPTVDLVPGVPASTELAPGLPIPAIPQPDPIQPTAEPLITPTVQPTEAIIEPPSPFGPVNPPSYSVAKLTETLDATDSAVGPITHETNISQEAFNALCQTGHVAAFLDAPQNEAARDRVQALLDSLGNTESRMTQLGKLGGELLGRKDAPAQGIAIAGTVRGVGLQNGVQGIVLDLPASDKTCVVMDPQAAAVQQGDQLVVLGGLIRNPKEHFAGYNGSREVLIWAAKVVKVTQ